MGIFDSLYIGNSGLNAAQIQIQTTGNNITNANNEFSTLVKEWSNKQERDFTEQAEI